MKKQIYKLLLIMPIFLSIIFIISSCEDTAVSPIADETIQGIVADLNENPIENASIEAVDDKDEVLASVLTGVDGSFSLTFKPKNVENTFIKIKHPEYLEIKESLKDFKKNNTQEKKKYYLQNGDDTCCGKLTIVTKIKGTDSVIKDVQVKLVKNGQTKRIGTTNENGSITFDKICAGEYWVRLYHSSFKVIEDDLNFGECDTISKEFEMERKDSVCCTGSVSFNIKNGEGEGIDSALIKLYYNNQVVQQGLTNDGQISFSNLCEGKHVVSITKAGKKAIEFYFVVECGKSYTYEKTMQQSEQNDCCGIIKVTIIDSVTNQPIKNAEIRLTKGGQLLSKYYTGEDGIITFTKICKGDYGIRIAHESYNVIEKQVSANTNCDSIYYTAKMKVKQNSDSCCNNTLKITVKNINNNQVVNGAKVGLWKNGQLVKYAYTENGLATITNICKNTYSVGILKEGFKEMEFQYTFDCGQTVELEKKITPISSDSCCGVLKFTILDKTTNSPIKNVEVKLGKQNSTISKLYTNENGVVTFTNLCEGNYWVRIAKEGYKVKEEDGITIDTCLEKQITIKLEQNQNVDTCCNNSALFKVKDSQGNLITGAKIKIMRNGAVVYYDSTSQGIYQTPAQLCTGTYTYLISYNGKSVDGNFSVTCNQTVTIAKTIGSNVCCTAKIAIFPKDSSNNEPINGATVKLWKDGQLIKTLTVENGYVKFVEVCEGEYQISITHNDYDGVEFNVVAECDKLKEYTKQLSRK